MSYTPSGPPNDPRPAQDPYAQRHRSASDAEQVTTADPIVWSTPEPSHTGGGWHGPAAFAPGPAPPEDAPEHAEPAEEPAEQDAPMPPAEQAEVGGAQQERPPRDPTPVPPSQPPVPAAAEPPSGTAQSAGQTPASDDALTIGRSKTNSIVLDDMLVSRRHLRIAADDEGLVLEDLGSRNGTFVNGRRVQRTHLHEGDRIGVGSSTFEVRDGWLVSV